MAEKSSPHYIDFKFTKEIISTVIDEEVTEFVELPIGWNNKAIHILVKSGRKYIFRVTSTGFPKEKIENEVAAITHLQQREIQIPIPKVLKFGYANEKFGLHWILMEFMEGIKIQDNWSQFSISEKRSLLMQAASILQKLQSIEVNLIGGWRLDPENYSALISEYFYDHTLFNTEKEWIVERYLKCIHVLEEKELCPDISLFQELQKFGSQLPLIIDQFDKVPIVFYHGDIAFRNMLAKKDCEGNYQISALLDWEWAGSRPIYVDYQWSLLEDDSPSEELEWLHQHLAGCGINPSQEIPQYSLRMDLYFFIEETLVMDHWIDSERRESCFIQCRKVLDKFHSYYIKST